MIRCPRLGFLALALLSPALAFGAGSRAAAPLTTLPAGTSYPVHASEKNNTAGTGMVEF